MSVNETFFLVDQIPQYLVRIFVLLCQDLIFIVGIGNHFTIETRIKRFDVLPDGNPSQLSMDELTQFINSIFPEELIELDGIMPTFGHEKWTSFGYSLVRGIHGIYFLTNCYLEARQ